MHRDHLVEIDAILAAALKAADPCAAVSAAVKRSPPRASRPAVIAVGKAAPSMMLGYVDACPGSTDHITVVPEGVQAPPTAVVADHPFPTQRSVEAARRVKGFVETIAAGLAANDGFVVLLSGGASSLLTFPVPGLGLEDYAKATRELLQSGVDIRTLNCIRKHCEQLKGGRLAALMGALPCDTYILSDVVGDELETVGSGPTLPDSTTFADACRAFDRQFKFTHAARALLPHLREGALGKFPETPKPGALPGSKAYLVASNLSAVRAAAQEARNRGRSDVVTRTGIVGSTALAGQRLAAEAIEHATPGAIIYGGETTVDVQGKRGRGGRNQELGLAAALEIDGYKGITIAAFATDGVDGPTDAAGVIVSGETCAQAAAAGLDPRSALAEHDSYTFFDALGRAGYPHLIRTGPTGTNVNDLAIALTD